MHHIFKLLALSILIVSTARADNTVWATAVSKNKSAGTAIVFRYIKQLPKGLKRESQPERIIIVWKYAGNNGMPSEVDQVRMNELEDALQPAVEHNGFSTLALVSTGNGFKEWIYYAKSEPEFFNKLNLALGKLKPFPIEIHSAPDPTWSSYQNFLAQVRE